jgi:hypothetical protein
MYKIMKKLILVLFVSLFAMASMAQRGTLNTVAVDTIQGAETVNFAIGTTILGSYNSLSITALCTELGGTSDGTLTLYGSHDGTNYVFINGTGQEVLSASPKTAIADSTLNVLTIVDALVANWIIKDVPYRYYRVAGVGTSSDTTQINITYVYK